MGVPILGGFLLLGGVVTLLAIFIRKIPALSQLPPEPNTQGLTEKLGAWAQSIDWSGLGVRILRVLEIFVRGTRKFFFSFLRYSEHWIRGLNRSALKMAGEAPPQFLPKFLTRIKRRQAFVEEERKLLEWVTQHPDDIESYKRLGNLYLHAGNVRDARAAYEQVLKLRPDDEDTKRNLDELATK